MTVSHRSTVEVHEQAVRLFERGRYFEALSLAEQACESESAQDLAFADILTLLADLRRELGYYAQAEQPYLQALSIKAALLGKEHPDYARTLQGLAKLYEWLGQYAQAAPLFNTALTIRRQALGEEHPDYAQTLHDIGFLHDLRGRRVEGEKLVRRALEIRKKSLGEDHPDIAQSLTAPSRHWRR